MLQKTAFENRIIYRNIKGVVQMTADEKTIFEADVEAYADTILRIAVQNTKNCHDAEDIVQETFIRLMKNTSGFDSDEHKKAWLIRVAINLCHDRARSAWFRKNQPLADYGCISFADDFQSIEYAELIRSLPEHQRNALYLFCFEGYSLEEISDITGRNAKTVGSDIYRARKKLRLELNEGGLKNE